MEVILNDIENTPREDTILRMNEAEIRDFFENANDLIQSAGPDGSIIYVNNNWLTVMGYTRQEMAGLNITDIVRDDQIPHVFAILNRLKNGETLELVECIFLTKNGREVYVEGNITAHFENGRFISTLGIFRDISKRKIVEETYGLMVNSLPVPIMIIQDGRFRLVNPAFQTLTEFSENELFNKIAGDIVHLEDRARLLKTLARTLKTKRPVSIEFRLMRKSGEVRWVTATGITIPYNSGQAYLGSVIDLTERKLVEDTLQESQSRYHTLFNSASDAIFIHDMNGRFLEVNDAACKLWGYARNEFLKLHFSDIESPRFRNLMQNRIRELLARATFNAESEGINCNGQTIPIELHSRKIEYEKKPAILHVAQDISDRQQAEMDRKRYEARLESLLRISEFKTDHLDEMLDFVLGEAVELTDSKIGFIYFFDANGQELTLSSFSRNVVKLGANKIDHSQCHLGKTGILGEAVRQRKPIILNTRQTPGLLNNGYPEGHYKIERYLAVPIFSGQEIVAVVGVANKELDYEIVDSQQITALMNPAWDILERRKAEEALRESEQRYRQLVELSQDGILQIDAQGYILAANAAACKMFGYASGEMLGFSLIDTYLPDQRAEAFERLKEFKTNKPQRFERQALHYNGSIFLIEVSVSPLTQGCFQEVVRDITERKRAETSLKESERRFRELAELLPILVFESDMKSNLTYFNNAANALFGEGATELHNVKLLDYIAPEDRVRCSKNIQRILSGEVLKGSEFTAVRINGQKFPVLAHSAIIRDEKGQAIGMRGTLIEISGRKKLEKDLRDSMQKYRILVDNLYDFVTEIDLNGEYSFVNPAFCNLVGKQPEELLGTLAGRTVYEEDVIQARENLENLFRQPYKAETEHRLNTPQGVRWVEWRSKSILDENGQVSAFTSVGRDITESKKAKEELEKANQRLLELDKLKDNFLSTVSHELRTPLTSIKSFVEILLNYDEDKATQKEFLGIINEESDRLTRLINDFLDLSKIQAGRMQWKNQEISMAEVIKSAAGATRPLIEKEKLSLSLDIEPDQPFIICDKDRIVQVITNILGNSIKFTPKGGNITIKAWWNRPDAPKYPNSVNVSIADTGIGIAPENHSKIFENFGQVGDVLKDKPKGTGLGLPISKKIVEYFGGKIWVKSELGKGTTFIFSLPVTKSSNNPSSTPASPLPTVAAIRNKTILVVDDEANIRRFIQHQLVSRGHKVIEAAGGQEAVEKARQYHPDLITLDVALPDLSGFDVTAVLKNDPNTQNIPILILSVIEDMQKAYRLGANDYITKPFNIDNLINKVHRLLKGDHKRILIADDDHAFTMSLEVELRKFGCIAIIAENGKQALDKIAEKQPDLILLDIKMPEMDGYEVIKALKNQPATANIPTIVMTGYEIDGGQVKALILGAHDYINKSAGFNHLFESIEKITRHYSSESSPSGTTPA